MPEPKKSNLRTGEGVRAKPLMYHDLAGQADGAAAAGASHVKGGQRTAQFAAPTWPGAAELRAGAFGLKMPGSYALRGFHRTQDSIPSSWAARI